MDAFTIQVGSYEAVLGKVKDGYVNLFLNFRPLNDGRGIVRTDFLGKLTTSGLLDITCLQDHLDGTGSMAVRLKEECTLQQLQQLLLDALNILAWEDTGDGCSCS